MPVRNCQNCGHKVSGLCIGCTTDGLTERSPPVGRYRHQRRDDGVRCITCGVWLAPVCGSCPPPLPLSASTPRATPVEVRFPNRLRS